MMGFDPKGDFAAITDGLETVALVRAGSGSATSVPHALRRRGTLHEADVSQGQATADDIYWHLPTAELPQRPCPGDWIVDAGGERFTVLSVREHTLDSRWRCLARNLAVAHGLDQYIDIERAVYTKGEGGADRPVWQVWKTGIRARIQPLDAAVGSRQERPATSLRVKVLVAGDLTPDPAQRIRAADGTIYTITGCRKPERIDALLEIDAVRVS
jgi:hypothetical protein